MVEHMLTAAEKSEYEEFHHTYNATTGFHQHVAASPTDNTSSTRYSPSEAIDSNSIGSLTTLEKQEAELHFQNLSRFHSKPITKETQEGITESFVDKDLRTRNGCIAGLALGWLISIASIGVGVYILFSGQPPLPSFLHHKVETIGFYDYYWTMHDPTDKFYIDRHRVYRFPKTIAILIPLVLNIILTIVLDIINYVHSTTLRWALWREGRLRFNSNLRLFTSAKEHPPNRWYINAVSALSLVFAYGAISLLTYDVYIRGVTDADANFITDEVSGERYALDFNGWAIFVLGASLLVQASICTWCLCCKPNLVVTWSSNPLHNVAACVSTGMLRGYVQSSPGSSAWGEKPNSISHPVMSGSSASDHTATEPQAVASFSYLGLDVPSVPPLELCGANDAKFHLGQVRRPLKRQRSAWSLIRSVRLVTVLIWALFCMAVIWTLIVMGIAIRSSSTTAAYIVENSGRSDILAYWQFYGQIGIYFATTERRDWLGLIIQCAVQSGITLGLHCVELIANVTRDEAIWRKASSRKGCDSKTSPLIAAIRSGQSVMLFAFKSIIQWIFGYAFSANVAAWMNLLPMIVMTVLILIVALFAEYLAKYRPKGPQPVTYGNLQALADLVDDWSPSTIYWGDKGGVGGVRQAGTADHPLPEIQMDALYSGVRSRFDSSQIIH
jgi:hypothetical protein